MRRHLLLFAGTAVYFAATIVSSYGGSLARSDRAAVLLPAGVVSTSASTPSRDVSREFAKYPGERRLTGAPARPKLNTARARRFRTVLRQAASEGPNFNGHYRIVYWGCGTNCIEWAVINLTNGAVWFAERPVSSCWAPGVDQPNFPDWFEHRLDSRLFHLYECRQGSMDQMRTNRHVYVWSGTRPRLLRVERLQ